MGVDPSGRDDGWIGDAERRLAGAFPGVFSPETVREALHAAYDRLAGGATVATYLVTLAERATRQRLEASARPGASAMSPIPEVLFVCVHNAGRSQMAAALLAHHAAGRVTVRSAGSAPATSLNPAVVAAMAEWGLSMETAVPKALSGESVRTADVVVTMGCGDACPVYPGTRYLDWVLPDPAGRPLAEVRPIRDEIDRRVRALLHELTGRS
ncbi:MAG TPA: arsenate reductase ArsC [Verrucomicrobiae bacterium]|nr:arsenate reductase ArsC [Verrucomicrobiae bacterium]